MALYEEFLTQWGIRGESLVVSMEDTVEEASPSLIRLK